MNKLEYFAAFLLIASSGFPFFLENHRILYPCTLVVLLIIAVFKQKFNKKNVRFFIFAIVLLLILYLLQGAQFFFINSILFSNYFLLLIRIIIGFLAVIIIVKNNFWIYFINIMQFFTIISLFFYILLIVFPNVESELILIGERFFTLPVKQEVTYAPSIFIYTLNIHDPTIPFAIRNSGPFWEPGSFAGFINMALIANAFNGITLFNRKNIVFILALLTTFSTGGYLIFFFVAFISIISTGKTKNIIIKLIISFCFLFVFNYIYINTPFLKNKIIKQENKAEEGEIGGRFGSAYIDIRDIYKNPILGRSRVPQLRYDKVYSKFNIANHRVCGLTDFIVKFGIPFSIFYFYFVFIGFKRLSFVFKKRNRLLSYIFFISFLLFSFYEPIMQLPFVFFLFFHHLVLPKRNILSS